MLSKPDQLVAVKVTDHKLERWFKVTIWNRGREQVGTVSLCRLTFLMEAITNRYPRAVKTSKNRPWQEGLTIRIKRGGRAIFKVLPLGN